MDLTLGVKAQRILTRNLRLKGSFLSNTCRGKGRSQSSHRQEQHTQIYTHNSQMPSHAHTLTPSQLCTHLLIVVSLCLEHAAQLSAVLWVENVSHIHTNHIHLKGVWLILLS